MPGLAMPTNTTNPLRNPVLYWRVTAYLLTLVTLLGIVMAIIWGGGRHNAQDQALAFDSHHGLGFTWTHNILHGVLAVAAFVFGFAPFSGRAVKVIAIVFGFVYLGLGVLGFFFANPIGDGITALNLGIAFNVIHILLGGWALLAGFGARYD